MLSGEHGTAILDGDPALGSLRLTSTRDDAPATVEEAVDDAGEWLLASFVESDRALLWAEFARAVELVEAVERSVRRRRTIDVHFETPSERGTFKTQMTALGCSLLVLTLAAVVIYLTVAATVELPPLVKKALVSLIFLPLGVFLAMQLLVFVARPSTRDGR
jgi:hypothetical protein